MPPGVLKRNSFASGCRAISNSYSARMPSIPPLLIQDLHIRVVHAATGELLRELTLDPSKDYQRVGECQGSAPARQVSSGR
jgi:hypothetical protein